VILNTDFIESSAKVVSLPDLKQQAEIVNQRHALEDPPRDARTLFGKDWPLLGAWLVHILERFSQRLHK
jgi:hypothetical protein